MILNGEETPFDPYADVVLRDRLGEVLPALVGADLRPAAGWEYPTSR